MLRIDKTFNFYSDPGHGWLAVKRGELRELGILDKITEFSYQCGGMVYLEEDKDAGTFLNAFKAKFGVDAKVVHHDTSGHSRIRGYEHFYHNPVTP